MLLWQAILLGVVQGAAEFLPISSSGHLALVQNLLALPDNLLAFDVGLHVGTLVAVVVALWPDLAGIVRDVVSLKWRSEGMRLGVLVVVGTIPAAIIGLLFNDMVENALGDPNVVAALLIVTGIILFSARRWSGGDRPIQALTWGNALVIGIAQAFALFPGISRSGTTIVAGLSTGLTGAAAARFSFLLSIPTILGAAVLKVPDFEGSQLGVETLIGGLTAAVVGYVALRWLLGLLGARDNARALGRFGIYVIVVGVLWLGVHVF